MMSTGVVSRDGPRGARHSEELARNGMTMIVVTHETGFARQVNFFDHPQSERRAFLGKILEH